MSALARLAVFGGALFLGFSACAPKETPAQTGELILALQSDMELPKDVDKVRIRIASYGNTVFSNDYEVGPSDLKIPATLALLANPDRPSAPVTIQVIGFRLRKPRVIRETVTTIPQRRIATLRVPIEWLCDETARDESGDVVSTCPAGETCVSGACVTSTVDSTTLPDYSARDVFGGGDGSGNGSCFDVGQCFMNASGFPVDLATCRVTLPDDDPNLNVALKLSGMGDGICSGDVCLIPLDGGEGGQWSRVGPGQVGFEVQLPRAACDRLRTGKVEAILASKQCATKTTSLPTCGPWSSTGAGPRVTPADGGFTPRPEGGFDAGCPVEGCKPPTCDPPPAPDGGLCTGIVSTAPPSASCRWDVPGSILWSGTAFCANLVNIQLANVPGTPGPPLMLPHFPMGMCGQDPGWQFVTGMSVLELCPAACSMSMMPGVRVEFTYGCPTTGPFPMRPPDAGPPDAPPLFDSGPPPGGQMLPIAAGSFTLGCAPGDTACGPDEQPRHPVNVSSFSIDATEVTQGDWDTCIRAGRCVAPPCSWEPTNKAAWPVSCVSWDEAQRYCAWAGKRLPTEAEWEIAARGATDTMYPWGNAAPDCTRANFSLCSFAAPQAARSFVAGVSPVGALDMAGNVAEWVLDWYGPYEPTPPPNPMGPPNGIQRVVRGGDFRSPASDMRSSHRRAVDPGLRQDSTGFRCVRPG